MKKLTRKEMKNVSGGFAAPGDGAPCPNSCVKSGPDGSVKAGTCSKSSIVIGGVTYEGCDCSITGGSGC